MQVKVMGITFTKTKFDGLDGKTKVQWASVDESLVFTVDQEAVQIKGTLRLSTMGDLQQFAKFLGESLWSEHKSLQPRILRPGEQ